MPLYEYRCDACGHTFERIQKFSDPREDVCPKCGGPVKKLVSSPAIQFKGSGWYINDYAKKPSPDPGASAKSDGGSTSAKSDTAGKADTPAPKTTSGDSAKKD